MSINTTTTNGEGALKGTGSALTDLFFNIGASRNNIDGVKTNFDNAMLADMDTAAALLLWARDIRHNGAGERNTFRVLLRELIVSDPETAKKVINCVPACGRFDDLRAAIGTQLEDHAFDVWGAALKAGDAIAFKWVNIKKDKRLRKHLGFANERDFRKFVVAGREGTIVESKMCAGKWDEIDYGKLPSVASARYGKAFTKNDETRYQEFLNDENTTINASAIFPHDIYRTYAYGRDEATASKQWANMPDMGVSGNILVMADVSGSMGCTASGQVTCMDIAISLGVYLAEQCKGAYQNKLLTFSAKPTLCAIPEARSLGSKFDFVRHMDWGMNTDLSKAYKALLNDARKHNVTQDQMPTHILILSDMQFDEASGSSSYSWGSNRGSLFDDGADKALQKFQTSYTKMQGEFATHGYKIPNIVYWNLKAACGNVPAMRHDNGIALVSGFAPNVLKAVLAAEQLNPASIMNEALAPFKEMLAKA